MQVIPYLPFCGSCKEAFEFHAKALGGTVEMMMPYAGTPAEKDVDASWAILGVLARHVAVGCLPSTP